MGRGKRWLSALILALLMACFAGHAGAASFRTDSDRIDQSALSVLFLMSFDENDQMLRYGSCFSAFDGSTLVTSYDLLKDACWLMAIADDMDTYLVTRVIAADEKRNIALLEFFSPTDLSPLPLSTADDAKRGAPVVAIGVPEAVNTVSLGNISALYDEDGVSYIQYTAPIAQGSSGGALFDDAGLVIGLTTYALPDSQNMNLAVDIKEVIALMEANKYSRRQSINAYFGRPEETPFPFPLPDPDAAYRQDPNATGAPGATSAPDTTPGPEATFAPDGTPGPDALLAAPENVKAAHDAAGVAITWDAAAGAMLYAVYRSPSRDFGYQTIGTSDDTSFTDRTAGDNAFFYKVAALQGDQSSELSYPADGKPDYAENQDLGMPKYLKTKTSTQGATITWSAVKHASSYHVFRSKDKNKGFERVAMVSENEFTDQSAQMGTTYYYRVACISGMYKSQLSDAAAAKMPKATATPRPTATPYMEPEYFVQVGKTAQWEKKDGYWMVNPKIANGSKSSTVDGFTVTYCCENILGDLITNQNTGEYYTSFDYDRAIKPMKTVMAGNALLSGYDDVAYIHVAVTRVHTADGRTIEYPEDVWEFRSIDLE